jgi:hypothetical protein
MRIEVVLEIDYEDHAHVENAERVLSDHLRRVFPSQLAPLVQYRSVTSACRLVEMTVDPMTDEEYDRFLESKGIDKEQRDIHLLLRKSSRRRGRP